MINNNGLSEKEVIINRNKYGMNIAGIRINNHMNLQFSPDEKLQKDMQMYVIGKDKDLQHFNG